MRKSRTTLIKRTLLAAFILDGITIAKNVFGFICNLFAAQHTS